MTDSLSIAVHALTATFPKAPVPEPHHQMQFSIISRNTCWEESYFSAEMQLTYSTAQADRAGEEKQWKERLRE